MDLHNQDLFITLVTIHLGLRKELTLSVPCTHAGTQVPSTLSPEETYHSLTLHGQELVTWPGLNVRDWKIYLAACSGKGNTFDKHLTSTIQ